MAKARIHRIRTVTAAAAGLLGLVASCVTIASAPAGAATDSTTAVRGAFYHYTGRKPLSEIPRGTVLKSRVVTYHLQGVPVPLEAVQLLYRTRTQLGRPTVNVTSVIRPVIPLSSTPKLVSYQSFYDSLNPNDEPSVAIAGGSGLGDTLANVETTLIAPLLLAGYTINVPDTEGQAADFADGPVYGTNTLDSLLAASNSAKAGVGHRSKIGLIGYSGGAIATEWAAELAHSYTPGIAGRLVGSAIGGVLVDPDHNLHYIEGSTVWAGVLVMALIGIARGYDVNLVKYANPYGRALFAKLKTASIGTVLGEYPGLTWSQIAKKRYPEPEDVPVFVRLANKLIMGTGGTPTSPMFIGQGTGGQLEGTSGSKPGIGAGDGVMIAGDVRSLAREYCSRGVRVDYTQYPTSHVTTVPLWTPQAYSWLVQRFAGGKAPSSCGSIAKGNSLAPISRHP